MNIFEPLVDRRIQLEYTYFGPDNELFACGLEPKKVSSKYTPVTVDFNPFDYDVIMSGPSKKSLSNTNTLCQPDNKFTQDRCWHGGGFAMVEIVRRSKGIQFIVFVCLHSKWSPHTFN